MKIAVIGATGAVGREMLTDLMDSRLANLDIQAFASPRSEGREIVEGGRRFNVQAYSLDRLAGFSYALMSAGSAFSKLASPELAAQGITVIDNSSAFRGDPRYPLIVPEVNGNELLGKKHTIIANPNCSTIQLVVSLLPLHKAFGLKRVWVSTYQSVSGTGQKGILELSEQKTGKKQDAEVYAKRIDNNLLSFIGDIEASGHCEEEVKIITESRRILGLVDLEVFVQTTRVPVSNCHSESVTVELDSEVPSLAAVLEVFARSEGIVLERTLAGKDLPSPIDWVKRREVSVSRVRLPYGAKSSRFVTFWNIADNLKKGAATNAVSILEKLL